jgi:uncharacterized protein (DUF362 family)
MPEGLLSIICDAGLDYPDGDEWFSPDERFPEYSFLPIARQPNPVYRAVRNVFRQAGLDQAHFDKPEWNPLGAYIRPGSRVFVLCNFVYHRRPGESLRSFQAKCVHGSVLRPILEYALIAAGPRGRVTFGNAPLQSCDFERAIRETGARSVSEFYDSVGVPLTYRDLRLYVTERSLSGRVVREERREMEQNAVAFDLGDRSLLNDFGSTARFRVADYNPDETERFHSDGRHVYVVHREIADADVIISLAKLKTHQKVGLTCCLKGFVGAIGLKQCLAHHRAGTPTSGGDEAPDAHWPARYLSRLHESVHHMRFGGASRAVMEIVDRNLGRVAGRSGTILNGAWHGNDTAWRMTLDIARILHYGTNKGILASQRERVHLGFIDGIVGGEGEGPLSPRPVRSGLLLFGDNVSLVDLACCNLIGFEPAKVPLVWHAVYGPDPVTGKVDPSSAAVYANGRPISFSRIAQLCSHKYRAPRGWTGYVERDAENESDSSVSQPANGRRS